MMVETESFDSLGRSWPDSRARAALGRLCSQQHLGEAQTIPVRLTNQNQVFLDTWRPTRVAIPAWLLEKRASGFIAGKKSFLKASYGKATIYHLYNGGRTWVPTVPRSVGKPDDTFDMKVCLLTPADFLDAFPKLTMGTNRPRAWMAEWTEIIIPDGEGELTLDATQGPPIEGISHYTVRGRIVEDLVFQKGSLFTTIEVKDVFAASRFFQLHHNGHRQAWVSLNKRGSFRTRLFSFDGVRWRITYRVSKGYNSTVVYLSDPSVLYALDAFEMDSPEVGCPWADRSFLVRGVKPHRGLEQMMVQHADCYETGRIGAEIAYSILKGKLGIHSLVIHEPNRGGPDLQTKDGRVLAESRFVSQVEPAQLKRQILRDLAQMTRKTRHEFRSNPSSEVGYAVISYFQAGKINSYVLEMASPR